MKPKVIYGKYDDMLICSYAAQGKKHQQKGIPCQDSCVFFKTASGGIFMAVADGVSSSPMSERASYRATEALKEFWQNYLSPYDSEQEIKSAFFASFNYALKQTKEDAADQNIPGALETTLTAVLLTGEGTLFGMNAGDSAAWIVAEDGEPICLTMRMQDDQGSVMALSEGPSSWQFFKAERRMSGVLLVTDGIQDIIQKEKQRAFITLAGYIKKNAADQAEAEDLTREEGFEAADDDISFCMLMAQESGQGNKCRHVNKDLKNEGSQKHEEKAAPPNPSEKNPGKREPAGPEPDGNAAGEDTQESGNKDAKEVDDGEKHSTKFRFPVLVLSVMIGMLLLIMLFLHLRARKNYTNHEQVTIVPIVEESAPKRENSE